MVVPLHQIMLLRKCPMAMRLIGLTPSRSAQRTKVRGLHFAAPGLGTQCLAMTHDTHGVSWCLPMVSSQESPRRKDGLLAGKSFLNVGFVLLGELLDGFHCIDLLLVLALKKHQWSQVVCFSSTDLWLGT